MTNGEKKKFRRFFPTREDHRLYLSALVGYLSIDRGLGIKAMQKSLGFNKGTLRDLLQKGK